MIFRAEIEDGKIMASLIDDNGIGARATINAEKSQLDSIAKVFGKLKSDIKKSVHPHWPDENRIDAIGQNGNNGEHYEEQVAPV